MLEAYLCMQSRNGTQLRHNISRKSCFSSILGLRRIEISNEQLYNRLSVMPMREVADERTEKFFKSKTKAIRLTEFVGVLIRHIAPFRLKHRHIHNLRIL